MKVFLYSILSLLSLISCNDETDAEKKWRLEQENKYQVITFFKDENSGLCFAKLKSLTTHGYSVISITYVPCDSIKNLKSVYINKPVN